MQRSVALWTVLGKEAGHHVDERYLPEQVISKPPDAEPLIATGRSISHAGGNRCFPTPISGDSLLYLTVAGDPPRR